MCREPPLRPGQHNVAHRKRFGRTLDVDGLAVTNGGVHGVASSHETRRVPGVENRDERRLEHVRPPSLPEASG